MITVFSLTHTYTNSLSLLQAVKSTPIFYSNTTDCRPPTHAESTLLVLPHSSCLFLFLCFLCGVWVCSAVVVAAVQIAVETWTFVVILFYFLILSTASASGSYIFIESSSRPLSPKISCCTCLKAYQNTLSESTAALLYFFVLSQWNPNFPSSLFTTREPTQVFFSKGNRID